MTVSDPRGGASSVRHCADLLYAGHRNLQRHQQTGIHRPTNLHSLEESSADPATHDRVSLLHLDRLESAGLIEGTRAAEMARVAAFGLVVRITLDPRRAAGRSVRDHAVEQGRGNSVPPVRRGGEPSRAAAPRHGLRAGTISTLVLGTYV